MDQVRQVLRYHHYSYRTEQTYCEWIIRFIKFHGNQKHPMEMGKSEIESLLSHLATNRRVAASTQRQALNALVFLYRHVLDQPVGDHDDSYFGEFLEDYRDDDPLYDHNQEALKTRIDEVMQALNHREREILRLRQLVGRNLLFVLVEVPRVLPTDQTLFLDGVELRLVEVVDVAHRLLPVVATVEVELPVEVEILVPAQTPELFRLLAQMALHFCERLGWIHHGEPTALLHLLDSLKHLYQFVSGVVDQAGFAEAQVAGFQ